MTTVSAPLFPYFSLCSVKKEEIKVVFVVLSCCVNVGRASETEKWEKMQILHLQVIIVSYCGEL